MKQAFGKTESDVRQEFLGAASALIEQAMKAGTTAATEDLIRSAAIAFEAATRPVAIDPPPDGGRAARAPIDPPPDGG